MPFPSSGNGNRLEMFVFTSVWSNDQSSVSPKMKLFRSLALLVSLGSYLGILESTSSVIHRIPVGSPLDPSPFCYPDASSSEPSVCLHLGTIPSWWLLEVSNTKSSSLPGDSIQVTMTFSLGLPLWKVT